MSGQRTTSAGENPPSDTAPTADSFDDPPPRPALADPPQQTESPANSGATERLARLSEAACSKVGDLLKNELLATSEEYKILGTFNGLTKERYAEMNANAQKLMAEMSLLQRTYAEMAPYLSQIDDVCDQVEKLEAVVNELDMYSRAIEAKYKRMR